MLKAVLVDDDANDLQSIADKLQRCAPDLTIVAQCANVPAAVKAIHAHQPDIVFTDIEMPGISGLQLPDFFSEDELRFELIFATSYSEFAVRAFQLSAIDYLVKPVDETLLAKAVEKVRKKQNYLQRERTALLKENLQAKDPRRIALPYNGGINFIDTADIIYLKADNVYTEIILQNAKPIVASKPLKELEALLPKPQFFRCHRSYVVNVQLVKEYVTANGGDIVMSNGTRIPLARDRKEEFASLWQHAKS